MKKPARDRDPRNRGEEREVQGESVVNRLEELAHRNEEDRRACQRRRSMLRSGKRSRGRAKSESIGIC